MTIESKIREIVEKALNEEGYTICEHAGFMEYDACQAEGLNAIVHALLSEFNITLKKGSEGE